MDRNGLQAMALNSSGISSSVPGITSVALSPFWVFFLFIYLFPCGGLGSSSLPRETAAASSP